MAAKKKAKSKSKKAPKKSFKTVVRSKLNATEKLAHAELKKAKTKFMTHEKKVREYAKKNPEKALAIAVAVGAALGAVAVAVAKRKRK
ncbi:hypothetical protein JW898_01560 [Candidatus Woesearchaeota archaeon]|nr:hypothetical protein [Candidatus Woesearchaeota archaeon]